MGRQRGLAGGRRRRLVRGVPYGLCDDLQRVLPRDHARAVRPDPARRLARVPPRRPELEQGLGRRLLPRQPGAGDPRRLRPGNVIRGVPMNANGDYTGTFLQLLNPYSLLVAVTGLFLIVTHGAAWLALKSEGELHARAVQCRKITFWTVPYTH